MATAHKSSPVITCHLSFFEHRCRQRGYTLDEVMLCVISRDGDQWTIDTNHEAYPRAPKPGFEPPESPPPAPTHGPGAELKKLISRVGITASSDCSCRSHVDMMDAWGCDECERRIDEIVGWLREEAGKRGLPFIDMAGRMLVRRAIKNARKATGI
jgi:hypothetical protein